MNLELILCLKFKALMDGVVEERVDPKTDQVSYTISRSSKVSQNIVEDEEMSTDEESLPEISRVDWGEDDDVLQEKQVSYKMRELSQNIEVDKEIKRDGDPMEGVSKEKRAKEDNIHETEQVSYKMRELSQNIVVDEEIKRDGDPMEGVSKEKRAKEDNIYDTEGHKFSEGIFRFGVANLQKDQLQSGKYYLPIFKVNNEKWRLFVKFSREYVGLFLVWIPINSLPSKVYCECEFKLVNIEDIEQSLKISIFEEFKTNADVHGFDFIISRDRLLDHKHRYIHNDEFIIECYIACGSAELVLPNNVQPPAIPYDESNSEKSDRAERTKYLLENNEGCDCEFEVSDGKQTVRMSASKFVLACASPVFHTMFFGSHKKEKIIKVTDLDINAFRIFLYYIHEVYWEFESQSQAISVYCAAKKYLVNDLELLCINYIWPTTTHNVWLAFNFAVTFQLLDMEKAALDIIQQNCEIVFEEKCFCEISQESLQMLVQRNQLDIPEIELFKAVVKWAKFQCKDQGLEICGLNLRSVTGDALRHIRFLAMTAEQFVDSPYESGMLTAEERSIALTRITTSQLDVPLPYLSCLRKQRLYKDIYANENCIQLFSYI